MSDLTFLSTPIATRDEGEVFIAMLIAHNWLFHFEDDVFDIIWGDAPNAPSDNQLVQMDERRNELYEGEFDWEEHDCPIGYALHLMHLAEE